MALRLLHPTCNLTVPSLFPLISFSIIQMHDPHFSNKFCRHFSSPAKYPHSQTILTPYTGSSTLAAARQLQTLSIFSVCWQVWHHDAVRRRLLLSRRRCRRPFLDRVLQFSAQPSYIRLLQPRLQRSFQEHTSVRLPVLLQLLEDADADAVRLAKSYKRHFEPQSKHSRPWTEQLRRTDRGVRPTGRAAIGGSRREGSCYSGNKSWGTSDVWGCCWATWGTQRVDCLVS